MEDGVDVVVRLDERLEADLTRTAQQRLVGADVHLDFALASLVQLVGCFIIRAIAAFSASRRAVCIYHVANPFSSLRPPMLCRIVASLYMMWGATGQQSSLLCRATQWRRCGVAT